MTRICVAIVLLFAVTVSAVAAAKAPPKRWIVSCTTQQKCTALERKLVSRGFLVKGTGKGWIAVIKNPRNARWAKEADLSLSASFGDLTAYGERDFRGVTRRIPRPTRP